MKRTDFGEKLKEQIKLLNNACDRYDSGEIVEAINIASRLRVILHDTDSSHSALKLLGIKDQISYYDTSWDNNEPNMASYLGLVFIRMTYSGSSYIPFLDDFPHTARWIKFRDWWEGIVIKDQSGSVFNRKDIVLDIANKDGGSHIDKHVPKKYDMLKNNSVKMYTNHNGNLTAIDNLHLATCRQIAHELLKSIEEFYKNESK